VPELTTANNVERAIAANIAASTRELAEIETGRGFSSLVPLDRARGGGLVQVKSLDELPENLIRQLYDPSIALERQLYLISPTASNGTVDYYGTRMMTSSLKNYAVDAADGLSFIHMHQPSRWLGRVYDGHYKQARAPQTARTEMDVYMPVGMEVGGVDTSQMVIAFRSGVARDVSITFDPGEIICSLDGRKMARSFWDLIFADPDDPESPCNHMAGIEYEYDGKRQMAIGQVEDAHVIELSSVYRGATTGAQLPYRSRAVVLDERVEADMGDALDSLTLRMAGWHAELGRLDRREALQVESRFRGVRFPSVTDRIYGSAQTRSAESWTCGASRGLPVDEDSAWDGAAAKESIFEDAGFDGDSPDSARARRGFLAYDSANADKKSSYKLPFAKVVSGTLTAFRSGLDAAASRLSGTDIPDSVKSDAQAVLDSYAKKKKTANHVDQESRSMPPEETTETTAPTAIVEPSTARSAAVGDTTGLTDETVATSRSDSAAAEPPPASGSAAPPVVTEVTPVARVAEVELDPVLTRMLATMTEAGLLSDQVEGTVVTVDVFARIREVGVEFKREKAWAAWGRRYREELQADVRREGVRAFGGSGWNEAAYAPTINGGTPDDLNALRDHLRSIGDERLRGGRATHDEPDGNQPPKPAVNGHVIPDSAYVSR
jgi:hypothetical protein